ncbi:MAG: OsmC family protein [Anaerolineaceae bacterium]|nr:MAG: OsmC family protein [Anaerolineaceae bacterium]
MEMEITFPGGARVDVNFGDHTIYTDQPPIGGGEDSAPTPFNTFLASIGACAGIYVLSFLRKREISTEGVRLIQQIHRDSNTGLVDQIDLEIELQDDFPEKYRAPIIRAVELCAVKKQIEKPPQFNVTVNNNPLG